MPEVRIAAEPRSEFGKGAARRTRRSGQVPAVVYGHGREPVHVSIPGHDLMMALKTANVLLTVPVEGKDHLVLPKAVQRDPIRGFIEHVDLVVVRRGEKVTVEIPITLVGDPDPEALIDHTLNTLTVEAEATHIPGGVDVDITGMKIGDHVRAGEIALPDGTTLAIDADALIVQGLAAPTAAQVDAEMSEAEAGAGIERDETDEETAGATAETKSGGSEES